MRMSAVTIKDSFVKLEWLRRQGRERNSKLNKQPDWEACSKNSEPFVLAGWSGSLGSKTSRVGWVKCQGTDQAEGTSKGLRMGQCRTDAGLRGDQGSTAEETGEKRWWTLAERLLRSFIAATVPVRGSQG